MSILIGRDTRILVQGITGKSGSLQAEVMLQYGAKIVCGVTPGKGGQTVHGVPVFDTVREAVEHTPVDAAISFVPPAAAMDSCFEVIDGGIPLLVLTTENIPEHDVQRILSYAALKGTRILGPGTAGLISPGESKLGAHPARMYTKGRVGVVSKSGALSYEVGKALTDAGIGQSTVAAIGGGPVWGTTTKDIVALFQADPETNIIVLLGEIGGDLEQQAAAYIAAHVDKPVIALIVGRAAPQGKSLGHAGAIIDGGGGGAAEKLAALRAAGVRVAASPSEIVAMIQAIQSAE
ncbi:succinate--CoA ligase subunit alpha [Eubacteriales bacterium OttesenSCG-928-A19]|nr:succinate--CoA ligase subunit alpha [Eubacteriales bacterium OttesenSCG-928-A19]